MAGGLAISTDQFKLVCLAGGALVMAVFVAGIAKSVFHMYFKRYSRLQQRRARKRKEVLYVQSNATKQINGLIGA